MRVVGNPDGWNWLLVHDDGLGSVGKWVLREKTNRVGAYLMLDANTIDVGAPFFSLAHFKAMVRALDEM